MTRDEIERRVKKYFDELPFPENWEIVEFALAIHDAVKEEDAQVADRQHDLVMKAQCGRLDGACCETTARCIGDEIRVSKVNK